MGRFERYFVKNDKTGKIHVWDCPCDNGDGYGDGYFIKSLASIIIDGFDVYGFTNLTKAKKFLKDVQNHYAYLYNKTPKLSIIKVKLSVETTQIEEK